MTGEVLRADAPAKVNLALVVGPTRADGKHEVVTVLQRVDLADEVAVQRAGEIAVTGFAEDTLVTAALEAIAARTGCVCTAHLDKRVPVAGGLGGGSSDAATALRLAHELAGAPLDPAELHAIAAGLGADVPFFLAEGAQLAEGDGTELTPVELPPDVAVLLVLPDGAVKESTAAVYAAFDARHGEEGFDERRRVLLDALSHLATPADLAALPGNDLARSPLEAELEQLGAIRADVSGAGPTLVALFEDDAAARRAAEAFAGRARTWQTRLRRYR